jgi:beta-phosphoglucomutase-like phosphatase (HAD superfamily)
MADLTILQMDGTLINSSPAVVKAWNLFAQTYPLDLEDILHCKFTASCSEGTFADIFS